MDWDQALNAQHDQSEGDPDVIPLEFSRTSAAGGAHMTHGGLMRNAVKDLSGHLQGQVADGGGYLVRHGGFAQDFAPALSRDSTDDDPRVRQSLHTRTCSHMALEASRQSVKPQSHSRSTYDAFYSAMILDSGKTLC
ncbi:hypothetical protein FS749_003395 [Ceratobasidium sp. UAMH 11750]|nr:hypothetical protein FS749_003395 [Ceratobasidium sp. UAMH 11750]